MKKILTIFFAIMLLATFAFADGGALVHTSSADLQPEWSAGGTANSYTVTISNTGGSSDDSINEIRIYQHPQYTNFTCGTPPSGWNVQYISPSPDSSYPAMCWYYTDINGSDVISPGESLDFTFSAVAPSSGCNMEWKFETRDTSDEWKTIYDSTSIDNAAPKITGFVETSCDTAKSAECAGVLPQGYACYISSREIIHIDVDDESSCNPPSGVSYCEYKTYIDGVLSNDDSGTWTATNGEVHQTISWDEDTTHRLVVTCYDVAGNEKVYDGVFKVDNQEPVTTLEIDGPYYNDNGVEYVDTVTELWLDPQDQGHLGDDGYLVDLLDYRITEVSPDYCTGVLDCNDAQGSGSFQHVTENSLPMDHFTLDEGCFLIEYHSTDQICNVETMNKKCIFSDHTAPQAEVSVSGPNLYWTPISEGSQRLIDIQEDSGSWDWIVTDNTGPTGTYYLNIAGVTAMGLLDDYKLNGNLDALHAAIRTGDYLVSEFLPTDASIRYNAFSVKFLYELGEVTGNSSYTTAADDVMEHIIHHENYFTNHNGNYCTTSGCTAHQLFEADKDLRSWSTDPSGIVVYDMFYYVIDAQLAGETAWASDMANEIDAYVSQSSFDDTIDYYDLGLATGIMGLSYGGLDYSSLLATLKSRQDSDGSFANQEIQSTAYALMAFAEVQSTPEARKAAMFLNNNFGYHTNIKGWLENDDDEYSEVTSEAVQGLSDLASYDGVWGNKDTSISISCTDQGEVAVGHENLCYRVEWDGVEQNICPNSYDTEERNGETYCCSPYHHESFSFGNEDSMHTFYYYCKDAVDKVSDVDSFSIRMDDTAPTITKTINGPSYGDCLPQSNDDKCYILGGVQGIGTSIDVSVEDGDPSGHNCNSDNVQCTWYYTWEGSDYTLDDFGEEGASVVFDEDSRHDLTITCHDALGNTVTDTEPFYVDMKAPVTTKTYGEPFVVSYDVNQNEYHWISGQTPITFTSTDEKVGVDKIRYRITKLDIPDEDCVAACDFDGSGAWQESDSNITITDDEESCHLIEFYALDKFGHRESTHKQCVFIDTTSPQGVKTIGIPSITDMESCDQFGTVSTRNRNEGMGSFSVGVGVQDASVCDSTDNPDQCAYDIPSNMEQWVQDVISVQGGDPAMGTGNVLVLSSGSLFDGVSDTSMGGGLTPCGTYNGYDMYDCESLDNFVVPVDSKLIFVSAEWAGSYGDPSIYDYMHASFDSEDYTMSIGDWDPSLIRGLYPEDSSGFSAMFDGDTLGTYHVVDVPAGTTLNLEVADTDDDVVDSMVILVPSSYFPATETCGNGILEGGEQCEPTTYDNDYACGDFYYPDGSGFSSVNPVTCNPETCRYDFTQCHEENLCEVNYVSQNTDILLNCTDTGDHPVGNEEVCFMVTKDGDDVTSDYCNNGDMDNNGYCCKNVNELHFAFEEDTKHELAYYCKDGVGNENDMDLEYFKVDSEAPDAEHEFTGAYYNDSGVNYIDTMSWIKLTSTDHGHTADADMPVEQYYRWQMVDDNCCVFGFCDITPEYNGWYVNGKIYDPITNPEGESTGSNEGHWDFTDNGFGQEPPLGAGALRLSIDDAGVAARSALYKGTKLSDITHMQYSTLTYDSSAPMPTFQLEIDWDCNLTTYDGNLIYSPTQNTDMSGDSVLEGVWQTWNPMNGVWYDSHGLIPSSNPKTWSEILSDYPDACIRPDFGRIGIKLGTSSSESNVWVDDVEFNDDVYDFERFGVYHPYSEPFSIPEESCHQVEYATEDALGNYNTYRFYTFVDKHKPETTLTIGSPNVTYENGTTFVGADTLMDLVAQDPEPHPSGVDYTQYRITRVDDSYCYDVETCEDAQGEGDWSTYEDSFAIPEESCHLIEYFSVDHVNKTEDVKKRCVFVDTTAPIPVKTIDEPKDEWHPMVGGQAGTSNEEAFYYPDINGNCWDDGNESMDCWRITRMTPINLVCEDQDPHPAGNNHVCFKAGLDGEDATEDYCEYNNGVMGDDGYCCLDSERVGFNFNEETEHTLDYYCVDGVGNKGDNDFEYFKVHGEKFTIDLRKKWNLISVPFVLLNDDPDVVFSSIADKIITVMTYHDGQWYAWSPGFPSNLNHILPGWGYWVLMDDDAELVVGGSLMQPGLIPPSRNLVAGWNLIGTYGTTLETLDFTSVGVTSMASSDDLNAMDVPYGTPVYCALTSLIDTQQGYPRWSALWGYYNYGLSDNGFYPLDACMNPDDYWGYENDYMYAGEGYWIELDVPENYAPATNCIWNMNNYCPNNPWT